MNVAWRPRVRSTITTGYRSSTCHLEGFGVDQVDVHARALEHHGASIHFHCWTRDEFLVQLREIARRYDLPVAVREHRANQHEFLVALRRTRRPAPGHVAG
jgi:hypothetical protein